MNRRAEPEVHAVHPAQQGMDDVHGILRAGENAVVVLEDERDTGGLEPAPGIFLRKDVQEALHQAVTAGISF